MYKAVFFDMDGVVVDSMPFHAEAWTRAFADILSIEVEHREIYLREGENARLTMDGISRDHGIEISRRDRIKVIREKDRIFDEIFEIRFFPKVKELLCELKEEGRILGLVTGSTKEVMDSIVNSGLDGLFDIMVSGDMLERGKPHPDPYLKALETAEKSGAAPGECVVVENAPSGVKSAKGAGLFCIALTTSLPEEWLTGADVVVDSPERAVDFIKRADYIP